MTKTKSNEKLFFFVSLLFQQKPSKTIFRESFSLNKFEPNSWLSPEGVSEQCVNVRGWGGFSLEAIC